MRKGFKILLFVGLGMVAAALLVFLLAFGLSGFRFSKMISLASTGQSAEAVEENADRKEKKISEPFDSVRIETASDEVILKKAKDNSCRIEYTERGNVEYELSVEKGTLQLIQKDSPDPVRSWENLENLIPNILAEIQGGIALGDYDIILYLPEKNYETLEISDVSGNIVFDDQCSFRTVALSNASGDIRVKNLKETSILTASVVSGTIYAAGMEIKGDLSLSSVSGDMKLEDMKVSGKADITTTSGEVTLKDSVLSTLKEESISGAVNIEFLESEDLKIKTVSGDVKGRIRGERDFRCSTTSGDVSVPNGGTSVWTIETVSGDIEISN